MIGKSNRRASDGREEETGEQWGGARDMHVMGKTERKTSDAEDQETGK